MNASALANLLDDLSSAQAAHTAIYGSAIDSFVKDVECRYEREVATFMSARQPETALAGLLEPTFAAVDGYLRWAKWMGRTASNLSVLLSQSAPAVERLALCTLPYVGGRLIDDGLDDHITYRGQRLSVVGELRRLRPQAPTNLSCALSVYWGWLLVQHTFIRLEALGQTETLRQVRRLFDTLTQGLFAEAAVDGQIEPAQYFRIVTQKSSTYDMMLHKAVAQDLPPQERDQILALVARISVLGQLINDWTDRDEDQARAQMNAFTSGVYSPTSRSDDLLRRAEDLWLYARSAPVPVPGLTAAMLTTLRLERLQESARSLSAGR